MGFFTRSDPVKRIQARVSRQEIERDHPDVVSEIHTAAHRAGVTEERRRCLALIDLAAEHCLTSDVVKGLITSDISASDAFYKVRNESRAHTMAMGQRWLNDGIAPVEVAPIATETEDDDVSMAINAAMRVNEMRKGGQIKPGR